MYILIPSDNGYDKMILPYDSEIFVAAEEN